MLDFQTVRAGWPDRASSGGFKNANSDQVLAAQTVIPATQEAEVRRMVACNQNGK
jgi:hypothetical protein